jgi:uncharacterized membrane protein YqjE
MPETAATTAGLIQTFRRLLETFVAIIESRVELAAVELREEKARIVILLMLAGLTLFAVMMAAMLLTGLILYFCRAHLSWTLGCFGGFYACLSYLGWRGLRRELDKPFFADTAAQLKKDREWLIPRQ